MIQAVIFDLDGTLLDTLQDLAEATNAMLQQLGCPTHELTEYRRLIGEGMRNLVQDALPQAKRDKVTLAQALEALAREYRARWRLHTRPYEGVTGLLDELKARGVRLAVLSNKADTFTQEMIAWYFGSERFVRVSGSRPDAPRKPDPTIALELAVAMQVEPGRTAFVGDTHIDVETARAARMLPIGVTWGFRQPAELVASGARALAKDPRHLLELLAQIA
jgi:phosphoglycolate phosphatase